MLNSLFARPRAGRSVASRISRQTIASAVEALECRRHLSTTPVYQLDYNSEDPPAVASGVSASHDYDPGSAIWAAFYSNPFEGGAPADSYGDSFTVTLTSLPAHTMVRTQVAWGDYTAIDDPADTDEISITSAGFTTTVTSSDAGQQITGRLNKWVAHSGSSVTITVSASDLESSDLYQLEGITVEVYNPTVSVTGGGTIDEDSDTPATIGLNRDLPTDYNATYDDAVPDTIVSITRGGTATPEYDYTGDLPSSTATIGNSSATKNFDVLPVFDDDELEDTETVLLTANSGTGYTVGTPNQAQVNLQNKAKIRLNPADPQAAGSSSLNRLQTTAGGNTDYLSVLATLAGNPTAVNLGFEARPAAGGAVVAGITATAVQTAAGVYKVTISVGAAVPAGNYNIKVYDTQNAKTPPMFIYITV